MYICIYGKYICIYLKCIHIYIYIIFCNYNDNFIVSPTRLVYLFALESYSDMCFELCDYKMYSTLQITKEKAGPGISGIFRDPQ